MSNPTRKARLRGVVFDMDGTLTVPVIDFAAMYRAVLGDPEYLRVRAENPSGIDILHHIESWDPDRQKKANEIIAEYERRGLDRLQIMPVFLFLSTLDTLITPPLQSLGSLLRMHIHPLKETRECCLREREGGREGGRLITGKAGGLDPGQHRPSEVPEGRMGEGRLREGLMVALILATTALIEIAVDLAWAVLAGIGAPTAW
ncbi:hypothetical protein CDL15_Pgr019840 [Punica granatum]|uniref:Haloacid dehalogenase-like hydrolase domain-containing protein At2g33255 n=1 Tax=Punica granatum TaxID=22663 RepID=A0A218XPZ4_PUNGR|nr:hypothetical protein CDL15_Pgr019840 [Punica granatum]